MAKRTAQRDKSPNPMTVATVGGTRLGMLTTATIGFGNKEGRRRRRRERNTAELNWNLNLDQD